MRGSRDYGLCEFAALTARWEQFQAGARPAQALGEQGTGVMAGRRNVWLY